MGKMTVRNTGWQPDGSSGPQVHLHYPSKHISTTRN